MAICQMVRYFFRSQCLGCFRSYGNFSFFAFILEDANVLLKCFIKVNSVLAQMFRAESKAWLRIIANELISNKGFLAWLECIFHLRRKLITQTREGTDPPTYASDTLTRFIFSRHNILKNTTTHGMQEHMQQSKTVVM